MKRISKRIISLLICLVMIYGIAFSAGAINSEYQLVFNIGI